MAKYMDIKRGKESRLLMQSAYHEMKVQSETFSFLQIYYTIKIQLESKAFQIQWLPVIPRVKPKFLLMTTRLSISCSNNFSKLNSNHSLQAPCDPSHTGLLSSSNRPNFPVSGLGACCSLYLENFPAPLLTFWLVASSASFRTRLKCHLLRRASLPS